MTRVSDTHWHGEYLRVPYELRRRERAYNAAVARFWICSIPSLGYLSGPWETRKGAMADAHKRITASVVGEV